MRMIDTNIILRYLVKPVTSADQAKQAATSNLFRQVKSGIEQITTCESIIAEVLFVLCSPRQYALSHQDAAARLHPILALRGFQVPQKRVYFRALDLFAHDSKLDFPDALLVAHLERQGITELLSYDTDFDRIPSVTRLEP